MTIAIDTSELKKVRIRVDDGKKIKRIKFAIYADAALPRLIEILDGRKPKTIGVVAGPGAFSATRTGVALANALAYGWNIPIVALSQAQFDSPDPLPPGALPPVAVRYATPPNITKKKTA
jgi:Inactive homolog of metal-dependent proteases, putative molecular chaperone